jgi:hypothetical protein
MAADTAGMEDMAVMAGITMVGIIMAGEATTEDTGAAAMATLTMEDIMAVMA